MSRDFRIRWRAAQSQQIAFDSYLIVIELLHLRKTGLHRSSPKKGEEILVPDPEVRTLLQRPVLRTSRSKDTSQLLDPVRLWFGNPDNESAAERGADF